MTIKMEDLIWLLWVSQGRIPPFKISNLGQFMKNVSPDGFVGGDISQAQVNQNGIEIINSSVNTLLGCGHMVSSLQEIDGICSECGRFCCKRHGCLAICAIEGIPVCRRCYEIIDGFVVSNLARKKLLWRHRLKKLSERRNTLIENQKKLLPQNIRLIKK